MLNINPKDCKEAPPIELSIDRQIEMMLDEKKDEKHKWNYIKVRILFYLFINFLLQKLQIPIMILNHLYLCLLNQAKLKHLYL